MILILGKTISDLNVLTYNNRDLKKQINKLTEDRDKLHEEILSQKSISFSRLH